MLVLASVIGREFDARRARPRRRDRGGRAARRCSTRRWPPASSRTSPAARAPSLRARPHPRHALRGAHQRRAASGCTGWRSRRSRRSTGTKPGPHLAELAHHAVAGGDFDRALRYARRAGDRALALLAYEEAARLYRDGARRARPHGDARRADRCELLLSLGEAQARAGNTPAAGRRSSRPPRSRDASACRASSPARRSATAGASSGRRAGDDDRLVPLLEEGLAALAEEDVELRVRLLARLAGALRDEPARDAPRRAEPGGASSSLGAQGTPRRSPTRSTAAPAPIIAPDTLAECLALASRALRGGRADRGQGADRARATPTGSSPRLHGRGHAPRRRPTSRR